VVGAEIGPKQSASARRESIPGKKTSRTQSSNQRVVMKVFIREATNMFISFSCGGHSLSHGGAARGGIGTSPHGVIKVWSVRAGHSLRFPRRDGRQGVV
jgi:hypothetical protein